MGTPSTTNVEDHGYGFSRRALRGHSHFISDVVISSDGAFALSASWDGELRLWDIATGKTTRQIVSGSRDGTIRLWNTLGECKYAISGNDSESQGHTEWVSCVRFSPSQSVPLIVS